MQELEAARERNDLDVTDLREMSVAELRQVGPTSSSTPPGRAQGRPRRRDPAAPDRARRPWTTDRHPRHRRRGLRLHAPARPAAEPRGRVRQLQPGPPLRPADRRPRRGAVRAPREQEKYWGLLRVDSVNGVDIETARRRPVFNDLTPVHPDELINLESDPKNLSQRMINLVNPIGKGQRALIVSPPKAGKTMLLKKMANGITANYPEILLMVALIGERPEEVTDMPAASRARSSAPPSTSRPRTTPTSPRWPSRSPSARSRPGATSSSCSTRSPASPAPTTSHLAVGPDAVGRHRPDRALPAKRFFGAARKIEEGGSLTIIGTCLVDTGSRMDDVIYEEFKGTGNSELILDRKLAEKRIFPSIDVKRSGTRREELLLEEGTLKMVWTMRRMLSAVGTNEGIELCSTASRRPTRTPSSSRLHEDPRLLGLSPLDDARGVAACGARSRTSNALASLLGRRLAGDAHARRPWSLLRAGSRRSAGLTADGRLPHETGAW